MSSATEVHADARAWQIIDRGAWLGPMPATAVVEGLRRGDILPSARCRETGTTTWTDVTRQPAFAEWKAWTRGGWMLFGLAYAIANWSLRVITDATMPWSMRAAVTGSIALMLVAVLRCSRRRAMLDPIAARSDRGLLRFGVAGGLIIRSIDMITKSLPPAIEIIPLTSLLGTIALTALVCRLLWIRQRRDAYATARESAA